ncbi:hypothetical protein HQ308_05170 [Rhodococcus sp. BP-241]|uniref:hypothetical protein n=1 Tax=Rhodococcus sp. BP-241 TaxID=2739441 RepID=UPI001C9B13B8|nr:hypothetical protein [Rhodococcus sp. BP-241]MBY6706189.1 hypothetical protein [Rhodococcus sp. BP-241]
MSNIADGTPVDRSEYVEPHIQERKVLPDGTTVQLRTASKRDGLAIDIAPGDGGRMRRVSSKR